LERNPYKKYFLEGFVVFFAWINLDIVPPIFYFSRMM
jgi:hypothetical protein